MAITDKRLIGDDGALLRGTLATKAVAPAAAGIYKIATKASAGSIFGDLAVGDWYVTGVAPTAASGDTAFALPTTRCGLS